jgi:hypothetical protein
MALTCLKEVIRCRFVSVAIVVNSFFLLSVLFFIILDLLALEISFFIMKAGLQQATVA